MSVNLDAASAVVETVATENNGETKAKSGKGRKPLPEVPSGKFTSPLTIDPKVNSLGGDKWGQESFCNLKDYWLTAELYHRQLADVRYAELVAKAEEMRTEHIAKADEAKRQATIQESIPVAVQSTAAKGSSAMSAMLAAVAEIMNNAEMSMEDKQATLVTMTGNPGLVQLLMSQVAK